MKCQNLNHGSFYPMIITIANGATWSIEFQIKGGYFDTRKKSLEDLNVVAGLPVPLSYDCVYDSV